MRAPPSHLSHSNSPRTSVQLRRRLFELAVTVGTTWFGLVIVATVCAWTVPPIPHTEAFLRQFTVIEPFFYSGQPAKTAGFLAGCLATPFLLLSGYFLARASSRRLSIETVDRLNFAAVILYFVLLAWCTEPFFYFPNPVLRIFPPSWLLLPVTYSKPFLTPLRIFFLLLVPLIGVLFIRAPRAKNSLNGAFVVLLLIWAAVNPTRFYPSADINNVAIYLYHLNSVLDALSQSVNGHHICVDFLHIYGGYVEFLALVVRCFPRALATPLAVLAVPHIVAVLCQLITARLLIRNAAILFVTGLTLLALQYMILGDIDYGYQTARAALPPVGLLAATLYFLRPSHLRYAVATVIAAVAPIWNLDTGVVLWVSWLATLLFLEFAARRLRGAILQVILQVAALACTLALFAAYLRIASGHWPQLGLLFKFQDVIVHSGYFCLPITLPGPWTAVLGFYVIGLAIALFHALRGRPSLHSTMVLMLSLFGIGSFSYYMGRSVESNLVAVVYPAALLAGVLCAEAEALVLRRRLPAHTTLFLLPPKIALFYWSFLFVATIPDLLDATRHVVTQWNNSAQTPLEANIAFVQRQVRPREPGVYFLSNHSGIYFYMSDTTRDLPIPGTIELLQTSDMDTLISAIKHRQIAKLFVDGNFGCLQMYRPDIYQAIDDAIAQNYQLSVMGPDGQVNLYLPRAGASPSGTHG